MTIPDGVTSIGGLALNDCVKTSPVLYRTGFQFQRNGVIVVLDKIKYAERLHEAHRKHSDTAWIYDFVY